MKEKITDLIILNIWGLLVRMHIDTFEFSHALEMLINERGGGFQEVFFSFFFFGSGLDEYL